MALPILAKIKNKELILNDYRLEIGHFLALKAAFKIDPECLNKVSLNNCGIDDNSFFSLLESCLELKNLNYLQLTKGDFGIKTVMLLADFFQKPAKLETLILNDFNL